MPVGLACWELARRPLPPAEDPSDESLLAGITQLRSSCCATYRCTGCLRPKYPLVGSAPPTAVARGIPHRCRCRRARYGISQSRSRSGVPGSTQPTDPSTTPAAKTQSTMQPHMCETSPATAPQDPADLARPRPPQDPAHRTAPRASLSTRSSDVEPAAAHPAAAGRTVVSPSAVAVHRRQPVADRWPLHGKVTSRLVACA